MRWMIPGRGPRASIAPMRTLVVSIFIACLGFADVARAMCGCMLQARPKLPTSGVVASAKIINKASKVVLVRDGDATTMTLANDFVGAPAEFGLVVPVPTVIQRKDVKVVGDEVFLELERQTAPRLVESEDPDPCPVLRPSAAPMMESRAMGSMGPPPPAPKRAKASDYGVKVESHFFAGEYEFAVLSGADSTRLVAWLQKLDYEVPDDAAAVIGSYIKQKMYFLVARVHVKEMGTAARFLRPIQVTYTTPKLMLPIRLGMVNADGPQELLVFALSKKGRVEPTNYRTAKLPTGQGDLPAFIKDELDRVYKAAFEEATKREDMRVVFIEAAMPVRSGGVDVVVANDAIRKSGAAFLSPQKIDEGAFVTRMHFRYDNSGFPEDLVLQETADTAPFIAKFNSRRHHLGPARCTQHEDYLRELPSRLDREVQVLANLTGWSIDELRTKQPKVTP